MIEIWKDIPEYEGLYQVSNLGRVRSLIKNNIILKPYLAGRGYLYVGLHRDKQIYKVAIHRLVAQVFLSNNDELPCVNHKDENKQNNNVNNLEWCTYAYNANYSHTTKKANDAVRKPVLCIETGIIYKSVSDACKAVNGKHARISGCCQHKKRYKSAYGYHWQYI